MPATTSWRPGFIDIHTHYDAQVFWDPSLTPSCFHGVTTVLAGNCGFSISPTRPEHHETIARTLENVEDMDFATLGAGIPWDFSTFPEYLASVERHGVNVNFAAYIGHTALRLFVMGDAAYERAATRDEIVQMQAVLREAMQAGAAGFATSLRPDASGNRRQTGPQSVRRAAGARGAVRRDARGGPRADRGHPRPGLRDRRAVRAAAPDGPTVHLRRAAHAPGRPPPSSRRAQSRGLGARRTGLAAGDAAAARAGDHARQPVHAQPEPGVRRAHPAVARRPPARVCRSGMARASAAAWVPRDTAFPTGTTSRSTRAARIPS